MATASNTKTPAPKASADNSKPEDDKNALVAGASGNLPEAWQGIDMAEDAGAGLEHVESKYLVIPHLRLLQAGSPQAKRSDPAYIEGAAEGRFLNTATAELFDKVIFVPCRFMPDHAEWEPGQQGEFIRSLGTDSTEFDRCEYRNDNGRSFFLHPNGNEMTQRALFYGMIVKLAEDGTVDFDKAVASLGGTSFAVARRWLTQISSFRLRDQSGKSFVAPMFARSFMLEASPQSNDENSWMAWKFAPYANVLDLPGGRELYLEARAFAHQVDKGEARAAEEDKNAGKPADTSTSGAKLDADIPF